MLATSSSQEIRKYFMFAATFYWDYPSLHQSSAELVLCGHISSTSSNDIIIFPELLCLQRKESFSPSRVAVFVITVFRLGRLVRWVDVFLFRSRLVDAMMHTFSSQMYATNLCKISVPSQNSMSHWITTSCGF